MAIYGHSGTDGATRNSRESFFAETVPQLLVNSQPHGCLGGDLNMIIDSIDATSNQAAKMSSSFKHLVKHLIGQTHSGLFTQLQFSIPGIIVTQEVRGPLELTDLITMVT